MMIMMSYFNNNQQIHRRQTQPQSKYHHHRHRHHVTTNLNWPVAVTITLLISTFTWPPVLPSELLTVSLNCSIVKAAEYNSVEILHKTIDDEFNFESLHTRSELFMFNISARTLSNVQIRCENDENAANSTTTVSAPSPFCTFEQLATPVERTGQVVDQLPQLIFAQERETFAGIDENSLCVARAINPFALTRVTTNLQHLCTDMRSCSLYEMKFKSTIKTIVEEANAINQIENEQPTTAIVEDKNLLIECPDRVSAMSSQNANNSLSCLFHPDENCIQNYVSKNNAATNNIFRLLEDMNRCVGCLTLLDKSKNYSQVTGQSVSQVKQIRVWRSWPKPNAVTDLKVQNLSSTRVEVSWSPPKNLNATFIKWYQIKWDVSKVKTNKTILQIDDLKPCVAYTVELVVIDQWNILSDAVIEPFTMPEDTPAAIRHPQFNTTSESAYIWWKPPNFAANCVKDYRIVVWLTTNNYTAKENVTTLIFGNSTGQNELFLTDLSACAVYTVQVIPVTYLLKDGKPRLFDIELKERVFDRPNVPILISATSETLQLTAFYSDPKNACNRIVGQFSCADVNGVDSQIEIALEHNQYTFTGNVSGLKPFTEYYCSVKIANTAGWSPYSLSAKLQTKEALPGVPNRIDAAVKTSSAFTVTWESPQLPNGIITNYRLHIEAIGPNYFVPNTIGCSNSDDKFNRTYLKEASDNSHLFDIGSPFVNYAVQVAAVNGAGAGIYSQMKIVTTKPYVAEYLTEFRVHNISGPLNLPDKYVAEALIKWKLPCQSNGRIVSFDGIFEGVRSGWDNHVLTFSEGFNETNPSEEYIFIENRLRPSFNYTVRLQTIVDGVHETGKTNMDSFVSPAGIPNKIENDDWGKIDIQKSSNPTAMATVLFNDKIYDSKMGEILYVSILLSGAMCKNDAEPPYGFLNTLVEWPNVLSWAESQQQSDNCIRQYQTTPMRWRPPLNSSVLSVANGNKPKELHDSVDENCVEFVIGSQNCDEHDDKFCNGPLESDTEYVLMIRLFTSTGYRDSNPVYFRTDFHIAVIPIMLSVFGLLSLAFLVGLVVLRRSKILHKIRQNQLVERNNCKLNDVSLKDFPTYMLNVGNNQEDTIRKEYTEINTIADSVSELTFFVAKENKTKNRYLNVYPFDYNRVILNCTENETDYINASFINGYKQNKEFIAAQGPKDTTSYDFWRMILQYRVEIIVMLTQLVEGDKEKCFSYFPDATSSIQFENITVANVKEDKYGAYTKRVLKVEQENGLKHMVLQYHFDEWPDHDCPENSTDLIRFIKMLRRTRKSVKTPVVVHCSAGVGRTGTLIALHILMERLKSERMINIFDTVKKLRGQRVKMVQTFQQYNFLYSCILDYVNKKHKKADSIIKSDVLRPSHNDRLMNIKKNTQSFTPNDIESAM